MISPWPPSVANGLPLSRGTASNTRSRRI
jgi:hypothetical protein